MSLNIGDRIGDYEIVRALGIGGMGEVYQVHNSITQRIEAIKILLPNLLEEEEIANRFLREIQVLARLDHSNIAALHTAQRIENQLVMVMEFVQGVTLAEKLQQGKLSLPEGLGYICQTLAALDYAHAQGVIHRDIKPANVMITAEGNVKLMDFGIAKAAGDRKLTKTGTTLGSLYYMSPEQVQGKIDTLDGRADLYSLGVVLYEIVTGMRPFVGDSEYAIMAAHLEQVPIPPIKLRPQLSPDLNNVILRVLAKDPAQRFQSATEFLGALQPLSQDPDSIVNDAESGQSVGSTTDQSPYTASTPASGRRTPYVLTGVFATIVTIAIAASFVPGLSGHRTASPPTLLLIDLRRVWHLLTLP
jgi:serine/threonine protein kinase